MSEFIRKITGIGGTNSVNYIPVVYYCYCPTARATKIKEIEWYADSAGTEETRVNSSFLPDFRGVTLAVYFRYGIAPLADAASNNCYKIKLEHKDAADTRNIPILLNSGEYYAGGEEEGTVLFLELSGDYFRVMNGVARHLIDELKTRIEEIEAGNGNFVSKEFDEATNQYKNDTGAANQFIYVKDGAVKANTQGLGGTTQPIYLNSSGKFTKTTRLIYRESDSAQVGSPELPVYIDVNGQARPVQVGQDEKVKQVSNSGTGWRNILACPGPITQTVSGQITTTIYGEGIELNTYQKKIRLYGNAGSRTTGSAVHIYDDTGTTLVTSMWAAVQGSDSTTGIGSMAVGNSISTGAGNAYGKMYVYGRNTGYNVIISGAAANNRTNTLPDKTGWIAVGGNGTDSGVGDISTPVYLDTDGILKKITGTIPTSLLPTDKYHSGTVTPAATSGTSGLRGSWINQGGASTLSITIPVYWGTSAPTGSSVTGALYIQI